MTETQLFNRYLPENARSYLEQNFYARVRDQTQLAAVIHDQNFRAAPEAHTALYSDHSVVHVRDVAHQILQVLDLSTGMLIPARSADRLEKFMKPYGVSVAYLHDIGMVDFSPLGRAMHPEFAAQFIFAPESDDLIEMIWAANCGGWADYLADLHQQAVLQIDPKIVLREMLALAMGHSKSKVPIRYLNDRAALRGLMQLSLSTELNVLYRQQQLDQLRTKLQPANKGLENEETLTEEAFALMQQGLRDAEMNLTRTQAPASDDRRRATLQRFYQNFEDESYRWLIADRTPARQLTSEVIDTLRALRCADALRQRGTTFKTSASYEIFVDQVSAEAIYAMRLDENHLYLVSASARAHSVGEANLASSELDTDGNLRFSFHHGAFSDSDAAQFAAHCAALIVDDIQADVIQSFQRPPESIGSLKAAHTMKILLENVDDNLSFAERLRAELIQLKPDLTGQIRIVPSLRHVAELERARYLAAADLDWSIDQRQDLLKKVGETGHKTAPIDPEFCFQHVRLCTLRTHETLLEAGAPAGFVYIPLTGGLNIIPLGGYESVKAQAWMPLGVTSVIRGAARNASVVAEQEVQLLMIPHEVYLKYWHFTYNLKELIDLLSPPTA